VFRSGDSFSGESSFRLDKNVIEIFSRDNICSNKLNFLFIIIKLFFVLLESKELVFDNFVLGNHVFNFKLFRLILNLESFNLLIQNINLIIVSISQSLFSIKVAFLKFQSLFLQLFSFYFFQIKNLVSQRVNLSLQSSNFIFQSSLISQKVVILFNSQAQRFFGSS
jgi:hypothetical protein